MEPSDPQKSLKFICFTVSASFSPLLGSDRFLKKFWEQLAAMLASKIDDFSKFSASRKASKFNRFWHRIFNDFHSNLGRFGAPRWRYVGAKIAYKSPQTHLRTRLGAIIHLDTLQASMLTALLEPESAQTPFQASILLDFARFLVDFS